MTVMTVQESCEAVWIAALDEFAKVMQQFPKRPSVAQLAAKTLPTVLSAAVADSVPQPEATGLKRLPGLSYGTTTE